MGKVKAKVKGQEWTVKIPLLTLTYPLDLSSW